MKIDYDAYAKMDQKELEKIHVHVTNILHLRKKKLENAINKRDVEELKEALEYNQDKKLPDYIWQIVNFVGMTEKELDFFLYVRSLPGFTDTIRGNLTHTQHALSESFENVKLFDFFVNHQEFSKELRNLADIGAILPQAPQEIIERVFSHKMLEPNEITFRIALGKNCFNYVQYFLDKNLVNFTENDYQDIYSKAWGADEYNVLEAVRERYPDYKQFTLLEMVQTLNVSNLVKDESYERYKTFVKGDEKVFLDTFRHHSATKEDIVAVMNCFHNLAPKENEKFQNFATLMVDEFPEHLEAIKEVGPKMTSGNFKEVYNKTMNYIELHINLERKDGIPDKKLKI